MPRRPRSRRQAGNRLPAYVSLSNGLTSTVLPSYIRIRAARQNVSRIWCHTTFPWVDFSDTPSSTKPNLA